MAQRKARGEGDLSLVQLLPNLLTITAICAGLTAIRFGVQQKYELAALLILLAAILDGVDGRIARLMKSDSQMGAELDSLADFLNFGVAPPVIVYFWAFHDMKSGGWIAVLVFAVCCVLRLARFNVASKSENGAEDADFFVGVPAPAGALLVMTPLYLSFAVSGSRIVPPLVIAIYMAAIGLLMISRIKTPSFKKASVSRRSAKYYIVGFAVFGAAVLTYVWVTLVALCMVYIGMILWSVRTSRVKPSAKGE
ncbi:MAG: CDP-diacylglycerol--serine O-phosphatidyltransferase [Paracoccaceae bacterium]